MKLRSAPSLFRTRSLLFSMIAFGLTSLVPLAQGSVITTILPPSGGATLNPGTGVSTPCPGNDSTTVVSFCNILTINETWTGTGPVVTPYAHTSAIPPCPGTFCATDYFVIKTITNKSGQTWGDFTIEIAPGAFFVAGFELPSEFGPVPSLTGGGTPTLTLLTGSELHWDGMNVANNSSFTVTFGMDTCGACFGTWSIDQTASTVPEPAVLVLTGGGLVSLGLLRRRRTRGRRLSV